VETKWLYTEFNRISCVVIKQCFLFSFRW